jgi:hypothetical protein
MTETTKDSGKGWYLIEDGTIIVESDEILDCIHERESERQRVTDTPPR